MPYIPYTDEQKQLANSVDLPTFLRMRGETLVPVGREFKLIYARTEEQTRITSDKLYDLADYALRVSVDEALRNQEQTQEEEIEPEPEIHSWRSW